MVHTLRSLYWYVGNRNLRYSWLLMYITLPITGAALALIAYVVLRGGLTTTFASSQDTSPFGMAALVGLFFAGDGREAQVGVRDAAGSG